jgi:putative inorganic carbon (hco3(-)) transporter
MTIADTPAFAPKRQAFDRANPEFLVAMAMTISAAVAYLATSDPVDALAIGAVPLAILLCIRAPLPICVLFVAFSFFRLHEAYPFLGGLKIPLALGILMFASLALHVFLIQSIKPFMTPELKRLVAMFAIVVIGIVFAQERDTAWNYVNNIYWKVILMTFAIAWLTRTDADYNFIARALVLSGTAVAAVAIYNKLNGIGLVEGTRVTIARIEKANIIADGQEVAAEFQSTLADPNDLSLVLLFPFAFAITLMVFRSSRFNTFLGAVATAAIGLAIIFTQSRGGLIGVMAVFAALGLHLIKSRTVMITLCVIAGLGLGAAMGLKGRVSGGDAEVTESGIDESAMGRIYAWGAAVNMAARRPLTGVGINNFAPAYFFFTDKWEKRDKAVHSTWFQVLGETGLPGIVVFLMLVTATFKSVWGNLNRLVAAGSPPILTATALSLFAGLAGFCAAGTFLTQAFTWPLYVMIGMTAALSQATRRFENDNVRPAVVMPQRIGVAVASRPTMRGMTGNT